MITKMKAKVQSNTLFLLFLLFLHLKDLRITTNNGSPPNISNELTSLMTQVIKWMSL